MSQPVLMVDTNMASPGNVLPVRIGSIPLSTGDVFWAEVDDDEVIEAVIVGTGGPGWAYARLNWAKELEGEYTLTEGQMSDG